MRLDRLLGLLRQRGPTPCLVHRGTAVSYASLDVMRRSDLAALEAAGVPAGAVVGLQSEHGPEAVSLLLALASRGCVAALIPPGTNAAAYVEASRAEFLARTGRGGPEIRTTGRPRDAHPLLERLRARCEPGMVIFSSGSTGTPKAALHSVDRFLSKFDGPGKRLRTLAFLRFDHIAGIDTLFYVLRAGGTLLVPETRDPVAIARLIEKHRVEVLPASPTFLNLLCLARVQDRFDLESLRIITYGSEPMSPATLARLREAFPAARLIQKYGATEFGSPRSRSRGDGSLWLQPKGDEVETRVRDGMLCVRSPAAMLGYLNAEAPFDEEGWLCTGDLVDVDGPWLRIRGRASDLINVGGEKVAPQEVEDVLLELDVVADAVVVGEPHPFVGRIVTARVNLTGQMPEREARRAIRRFCRTRLAAHKVPVRIDVVGHALATDRQKKTRIGGGGNFASGRTELRS